MMCIFLRVKNKGELSETKKIKYLLTGRVSLGGSMRYCPRQIVLFCLGFFAPFYFHSYSSVLSIIAK